MGDIDPSAFKGHVVFITGGTSGIGYGIAAQYVKSGASVILLGTNQVRGEKAAQALEAFAAETGQQVLFATGDVSCQADLKRAITRIEEQFGCLHTVVCCAGIGRKATLLETSAEDLERLYRVNVQGAIMTVQAAADLLKRSKGSAILISSDAGICGENHAGAYSVTKAAVNMAGKMLALDLASAGVRVNVVAPGDIVPGMKSMLKVGETVRDATDYLSWPTPPLGRYGEAADVAGAVLFLSSPQASFITGCVLLVDGGMRSGFFASIVSPRAYPEMI